MRGAFPSSGNALLPEGSAPVSFSDAATTDRNRSAEAENDAPESLAPLDLLRATLHSEFGLAPEQIQPHVDLMDDLDLDSIDLVDLAVSLEEQRGIRLNEEDLKSVRTVGDAVAVIGAALSRRGSGAA